MNKIGPLFRVFGPKVVGLFAGAISGWIFTKYNVILDKQELIELVVLMSGTGTAAAKTTEIFWNPAGAVAPDLVNKGVTEKAELKDLSEGAKEDWSSKP